MKIDLTNEFLNLLNEQVRFIAKDKPKSARKYKNDLLSCLKKDLTSPFTYKKSIYFDNELIRDYVFKGYTIVYKISKFHDEIQVFEFIKYMKTL